jgi:hypothetical protein
MDAITPAFRSRDHRMREETITPSARRMRKTSIGAATVFSLLIATFAASAETGNYGHDRLNALPPSEQAVALGRLDPDDHCVGVSALFKGMDKYNSAYWSVRCEDSKSYLIELKPNGKTTGLDCSVAKILGIDCFKTFEEESRESKAKNVEPVHRTFTDHGGGSLCPPPHRMTERDGCQ